jgi:hypothetical protein
MHFSKLFLVVAATLAAAHPGEVHDAHALKREIGARDAYAVAAKRALDACSSTTEAQQLNQRNVARRARTARQLRHSKGITTSK